LDDFDTKVIYVSIWIVLPIVIGITWWKVLIGFFIMHYTAGLILSIVFQLAHVVEETENPTPNELERWVYQFINYLQLILLQNKIVNWYTVV
jgi:linoleoyl-CoA desaturase